MSAAAPSGQASQNYLVVYRSSATPGDAASRIASAGGTVVANYSQIGVVVARSGSPSFADSVAGDARVEAVSSTAAFATRVDDDPASSEQSQAQDSGSQPGSLPNAPAADADTLSPLQWDMRQIHAPQAHSVTGGSPAVVVGDIDTGLDFTHPDLAANYDAADSADCSSGAPTPLLPGNDRNGHGTHTAGTIAAAANGIGIVGVAPNVRIAGIKSSNDAGFFFPEMVVCSFVWAGAHHIDVTNNSYFADPWLFNCRNDPAQRAIWKAEQRAIRYAMSQGTTVVAAEGNQSDDLSHPTQDVTSPDDSTPVARPIGNECVVVPVEIPGVIGVTASGNATQDGSVGQYPDHLKSFYSSYGVSSADVVAPGGDSVFGRTAESPNGRVLSTWPSNLPCARSVQEPPGPGEPDGSTYCYLQGTSMASPHVAGIAALVVSRFGDARNPQNGHMRPDQVAAYIQQTADPQVCPDTLPTGYDAFTATDNGATQQCAGGPGHTSWYGNGEADALNAVTHTAAN
jgi:subtilisin family serine protease